MVTRSNDDGHNHRLLNLDWVRVFAAIGVVWFHTQSAPVRAVAYSGLPAFLLLSMSLLSRQSPAPFQEYLEKRSNRLLNPWFFWSCVYLIVGIVQLARHGKPLADAFNWQLLWIGPKLHLWYLSYAFLASMAIWIILKAVDGKDNRLIISFAVGAGILLLVFQPGLQGRFGNIWPQAAFALPSLPLGLAMGRLMIGSRPNSWGLFTVAIAVLAGGCALFAQGDRSTAIAYAIGTSAVVLGAITAPVAVQVGSWLSPLTLGIYVLHPLAQMVLWKVLPATAPAPLRVLVVVLLCGIVTYWLRKLPIVRCFV
jgi:fucose 4-O-acetylase-like acetyltransferase